jgi:ADP-heptose:LPS heptosyltransferase
VPTLPVADDDDAFVASVLRGRDLPDRGFLVVHPFTAWRSKEWPIDRYATVLSALARDSGPRPTAIVTGSADEAELARRLCDLVTGLRIASLAGELTLGQSLALWSRAGLFLGGDTGALHASAALGVRTLALFGPTWPEVTGPVGFGHRVIQASRPAAHDEYRSVDGGRHMAAIREETVLDALRELLSERAADGPIC